MIQATMDRMWGGVSKQRGQKGWECGSSGRIPAWKAQGLEFNIQYHQNNFITPKWAEQGGTGQPQQKVQETLWKIPNHKRARGVT
jgi:hypothetical protein